MHINNRIIKYNSFFIEQTLRVNSTNTYLKKKIKKDTLTQDKIVVLTQFQTQGKGQRGRTWESQEGKNLLFSLYYVHKAEYPNIFLFNQWVTLCLIQTLKSLSVEATIKWPNDLMLGTYKVGGILIENLWSANRPYASIIGVGINVNQETFPAYLSSLATSLLLWEKKTYDSMDILKRFLDVFSFQEASLRHEKKVQKAYLNTLYGHGKLQTFYLVNQKRTIKAKIENIDSRGAIILKIDEQLKSFAPPEIKWIIGSS